MDENPYKAPTESSASSAARPGKIFATLWKRYPATITLLLAALVVGAYHAVNEYRIQAIMSREGSYLGENSDIDKLLNALGLPGMFPLYVVGVLTGSLAFAWVAFAVGMVAVYGIFGLVLDQCWKNVNRYN